MDKLKKISALILSASLLFACSNNNSVTPAKGNAPNSTSSNSGDSTYTGENSLAYTINGRHINLKDFMHDGDGKNWMALFLNKVKNDPSTGMLKVNLTNELTKEVFKFSIANSGSSSILHYSPSLSNFTNKKSKEADYMSPKYKNYYGDSVVINITSINATRVAGTFTGKFLSDDDKPVSLEITDGSFDIAFTTDKDK